MKIALDSVLRTGGSGATTAAAGLLTRPCCIGPALVSLIGGGSAGLSQVFASHHAEFAVLSGALLTGSIWINVRLQSQTWNKVVAAVCSVSAFLFVAHGFLF